MPSLPDVPRLITTRRLELRAPELAHVAALTVAVRATLPELQPWMPWATADYGEEACASSVQEAILDFEAKRDLRYHVFERATGDLVGSTGLHRIDWRVPRFEIGYWLATRYTGRGYASEAVRAQARMAFERLGAKRVEIRCDDRNAKSRAVAERCGFALDGVLRNYSVGPDGSLRHERVYSLTDVACLEDDAPT